MWSLVDQQDKRKKTRCALLNLLFSCLFWKIIFPFLYYSSSLFTSLNVGKNFRLFLLCFLISWEIRTAIVMQWCFKSRWNISEIRVWRFAVRLMNYATGSSERSFKIYSSFYFLFFMFCIFRSSPSKVTQLFCITWQFFLVQWYDNNNWNGDVIRTTVLVLPLLPFLVPLSILLFNFQASCCLS